MVQAPEMEQYGPGSILRMMFRNFLTYDHVEFNPGANLNVVIGPNGTGKSSIVAAICLGMGGNASVLGRDTDPKAYIQHGKKFAEIEIELKEEGRKNTVVKYKIKKEGASEYWIDGKKQTKAKVLEIAKGHKIQVDNLCQFLAQDKVTEFAKIKKQVLLENTQKAVALELLDLHRQLKEKQGTGGNMREELGTLERLQAQVGSDVDHLEPQYRAFHEMLARRELVEKLEIKKDYMIYEENRKVFLEKNQLKIRKQKELEAKKEAIGPSQKEYEKHKRNVDRKDDDFDRTRRELDALSERAEKSNREWEEQEERMKRLYDDLERRERDQEERKREVVEKELQMHTLARDMENLPDASNLQPEIDEISAQNEENRKEREELEQEKDRIVSLRQRYMAELNAINAELRKQNNKHDVRLRMMDGMGAQGREAANLWRYIQQHKDRFQQEIYVPMLEINLEESRLAKFVENVVGERDLVMFICQNNSDNERLMTIMKEQKFRGNVTVAPNFPIRPREVPAPLRNLGFSKYVSDLVSGPEPVMQYLCGISGISAVPVGTTESEKHMDAIAAAMLQLRVGTVLTENKRVGAKRSKYTGEPIVEDSSLRQGRHLVQNIQQTDGREDLVKEALEIEGRIRELNFAGIDARLIELQKLQEQLRNKKMELTASQKRRGVMKQQLRRVERELEDRRREVVDLTAERNRVKDHCRKHVDQQIKVMEEMAETLTLLEPKLHRMTEMGLEKSKLMRLVELKEKELKAAHEALKEMKDEIEDLIAEVEAKRKEVATQRDNLAARCDLPPKLLPRNKKEEQKLQEYFESLKALPKTIPEIEAKISEEHGRMLAAKGVNQNIVQEYEEKKAQSIQIQRRLEAHRNMVDNWSDDVSKIKKQWLGELDDVVAKISRSFGEFFSKLGCAGEVVIDNSEGEDNFVNYGIGINVKFRDSEQMTRLSHDRHSGGERSVATMLYMLALQELSQVPFRCVDEINQGMDAENERIVFEMVVELLSGGTGGARNLGRTQYFMLTPKLLPNLTFSRKMNVLVVHNGSGMLKGEDWDIKKFIERKKALRR